MDAWVSAGVLLQRLLLHQRVEADQLPGLGTVEREGKEAVSVSFCFCFVVRIKSNRFLFILFTSFFHSLDFGQRLWSLCENIARRKGGTWERMRKLGAEYLGMLDSFYIFLPKHLSSLPDCLTKLNIMVMVSSHA